MNIIKNDGCLDQVSENIACFCENTEVFTANEGVKKIQDVKIGDLVVTHQNRLRTVTQIHKNPLGNRKIYKLEVLRSTKIYVTGDHKFWSFYTKKFKYNKLSFGWNSIEELKTRMDNKVKKTQACFVSFPKGVNIEDLKNYKIDVMDYKNVIVVDPIKRLKILDSNKVVAISTKSSNAINRIWDISEDFANFIGIWLGDGHIKKRYNDVEGIAITVSTINKEEIDFIHKVCKDTFDRNVTSVTPTADNTTVISINSRIIGLIFIELFGSYFDGKKLPNMVFSWPKRLVNSLMAGLITSDGYISADCKVCLGLSNEKLTDQLYHLCKNFGIGASLRKREIRGMMTCCAYRMNIPLNAEIINQTRKYYKDDRIEKCKKRVENNNGDDDNFLKIFNITEVDRKDEYVYSLSVDEDNSFTVEGLIVQGLIVQDSNIKSPHTDIITSCELSSQKF